MRSCSPKRHAAQMTNRAGPDPVFISTYKYLHDLWSVWKGLGIPDLFHMHFCKRGNVDGSSPHQVLKSRIRRAERVTRRRTLFLAADPLGKEYPCEATMTRLFVSISSLIAWICPWGGSYAEPTDDTAVCSFLLDDRLGFSSSC
jgi:hypothetical protein